VSGRWVSRVLDSGLPPDLKFTAAVFASFASDDPHENGECWPSIGHVAHLRGLEERRVQYHVKELRRMEIVDIVRPATQWHPTRYRINPDKLPPRAPYKPPDRQGALFGAGGESPPVENSGVHSSAPQSGVHSTVPGVQPSAPDPSVRSVSTHTCTARARGATDSAVQPAAPLKGESALPLIVAPTRHPDHAAHAWCGRVCVPKFLHKEFRRALGGPVTKRPARLRAFYAETLSAIPTATPIGAEPLKFWRSAFAARFGGHSQARPHIASAPAAIAGDDVWSAILRGIERRVNRHTFESWFRDTSLAHDDGAVVEVACGAHGDLQGAWIRKHYGAIVAEAAAAVRPGVQVVFVGEARRTG